MSPTQTFYRKNKNNDILSITITTADTPEYTKVANSIAAMWEAAGIHTLIETINSYQLVRDVLRERSYEVLLYGEILGADPDFDFVVCH
jgi:MarR-like DNA-binding transcriptional regulator SgrR of sgrS sRNA